MYLIVDALHYLEFSGEVRGVLSMWAGNDRTVALQDLIEAVQDDLFDCSVPQQPVALSEIPPETQAVAFQAAHWQPAAQPLPAFRPGGQNRCGPTRCIALRWRRSERGKEEP